MQALRVDTAVGAFTVLLREDRAPETCRYFRRLAEHGDLDGGAIFRITAEKNREATAAHPIDVVQIGTPSGLDGPRRQIAHEPTNRTGLKHRQWIASASRFAPGEVYGSFFVCMRDEPELDFGGRRRADGRGYAAFGEIVDGRATLEEIYAKAERDELLDEPIPVDCVSVVETEQDSAIGNLDDHN